MTEPQNSQAGNWWDAFPAPRSKCPEMTADDLMKAFDDMDLTNDPKSFLLVDVRRNDWEVCHSYHFRCIWAFLSSWEEECYVNFWHLTDFMTWRAEPSQLLSTSLLRPSTSLAKSFWIYVIELLLSRLSSIVVSGFHSLFITSRTQENLN